MRGYWTCQRQTGGVRCRRVNANRKRNCERCGKPRPARRKPAHLVALETTYQEFIGRYGERCGICGRTPSRRRRLDRDHDHATGAVRGLLCARCNRQLPRWVTVEWLRAAARYLEEAKSVA